MQFIGHPKVGIKFQTGHSGILPGCDMLLLWFQTNHVQNSDLVGLLIQMVDLTFYIECSITSFPMNVFKFGGNLLLLLMH